jgi:hypothetical protein
VPDTTGLPPGYEQQDVTDLLNEGGLVAIAGGDGSGAAIRINQANAVMFAGRLRTGESVELPQAQHVHLFVALGSAVLEGVDSLGEGDAVRFTNEGPHSLVAGSGGAEVIVWATA